MTSDAGFSVGPLVLLAGIPLVVAGLAALIVGARRGRVIVAVVGLVLLCAAGSVVILLKEARSCTAGRITAVSMTPPLPPRPPDFDEELQAADLPSVEVDADEEATKVSLSGGGESKKVLSVQVGRHGKVQIDPFGGEEEPRKRSHRKLVDRVAEKVNGGKGVVLHVVRVGAFCVLLLLAYLFLDAGRRRRYIWPRRVAVAAAFAAVCVFLWRIGPLM